MPTPESHIRSITERGPNYNNIDTRGIPPTDLTKMGDFTGSNSLLPPCRISPPTVRDYDERDIERWQASAGAEPVGDDAGIVAQLLRVCIDSISYLLQLVAFSPVRRLLRRNMSLLKLWADGHGVWDGKLDSLLARSKNLRHTTLAVLNPLCKVLSSGLLKHGRVGSNEPEAIQLHASAAQIYSQTRWLLIESKESDTHSDSDSGSDSDSELSDHKRVVGNMKGLVEDVQMHVQCLLDLTNALEYPAIDPEPNDEPSILRIEQRAAHDYHTDLIVAKFPKAHVELVECLGKISWDRYQRMQQEREINANIPGGTAASAQKSSGTGSEFRDSALGPSLPSVSATGYAETVISFMTGITEGKRVHFPPLPSAAKTGAQFECNACGRHIRAVNNREWRKHLYLDLQPYTCLYASCVFSSKPFADRQLWSNHLELDHGLGPSWQSVTCPLCLDLTDAGKSKTLIHFARHMEDIALAALPREVESEVESEEESESSTDDGFQNTFEPVVTAIAPTKDTSPHHALEEPTTTVRLATNLSPARPGLEDPGVIKCVCGFLDDDGTTVLCEVCDSWQHIVCYYEDVLDVPDVHECVDCRPRPLDRAESTRKQRLRREQVPRLIRKTNIERRCQQMDPPISAAVLRHMDSFRASIQIAQPMTDYAWSILQPRLLAQLPAARQAENKFKAKQIEDVNFEARKREWQDVDVGRGHSSLNISSSNWNQSTSTSLEHQSPYTLPQDLAQPTALAATQGARVAYTRTGRISKAKTGLKVHNCACGRSYTRAEHLRRHQKNHAQEDALVCDICGKVFYRLDLLERHMERHESYTLEAKQSPSDSTRTRIPRLANVNGTADDEALTKCFNCGEAGHISTNKKLCSRLNGTKRMSEASGDAPPNDNEWISWALKNRSGQRARPPSPEPSHQELLATDHKSQEHLAKEQQKSIAGRQNTNYVAEGQIMQIPCDACQQRQTICDRWSLSCSACTVLNVLCTYTGLNEPRTPQGHKKSPTEEERKETSLMRRIGMCANCKKRKVKCDSGTPCRACIKHYKEDLVDYPCRDEQNAHRLVNERNAIRRATQTSGAQEG